MTRLEIRLLGGFEVVLGSRVVTDFETASTQALLVRLAIEPGAHLPRPVLAELLWPDRPAGRALANLRHSLAVLRRAIGDHQRDEPVLVANRDTLAIDPGADVGIDTTEFWRLACTPASAPGAVAAWEAAVALRRGPLLGGFDPALSEQWETWLLTTRTAIDAEAVDVYRRLAGLRERTGERTVALDLVREWLAVDRWDEEAHRYVIRLLALDGRSAAALDHSVTYTAELLDQLGVEPGDELRSLVDDVRSGRLTSPSVDVPELRPRPSLRQVEPCVARGRELAWLRGRLDDAVGGAGGVAFVTGAAGAGKTVLVRAFASDARARMPELRVVGGAGNAYTGPGDPFLPFRQILGLLLGDLEAAWTRGDLTPSEAGELWSGVPAAVEAVLDVGPYLLGTLIDAPALGRRFERGYPQHPLGPPLAAAVEAAAGRADDPMRQQQPILDQCARVLVRLATDRPTLVLLDDLHWADQGTIELLRHLAGQLTGVPILIVAAFRPADATGDAAVADPMRLMVHEVSAHSNSICQLELAGDRQFVDAWLDTEPNLLDQDFRDRLFQATHGHALFTVEMVAAMRRHGDLVADDHHRWITRGTIAWDDLPPRVEATIAARTALLPAEVRRDLEVASVQGETFVAEVVAEVRSGEASDVNLRLGDLAVPPHALVEPAGAELVGERRLNRYRFRHALIRQYLHEGLTAPDRTALHEATGRALATIYAGRLDDVAVELALHFDEAGLVDEAIEYRSLAGRRALRWSATAEATEHFRRAVELVHTLDASADRDRLELTLLTPLGACLQAVAGYNAPATDEVYERIRELIPLVGTTFESAQALGALTTIDGLRARYGDAIAAAEQLRDTAAQLGVTPIESVAHMQLGWLLLMTSRLAEAHQHLDRAIALYDEQWDPWLTHTVGIHVPSMALTWRAVTEVILGRPDQALADAAASIAEARRIGYPFGLAFVLAVGGCLVSGQLGEGDDVVAFAEEAASIATREDFAFYRAAAQLHRGLGLLFNGALGEGLREVELGLSAWSELGTEAFRSWIMCTQAEYQVAAGDLEAAAHVIAEIDRQLAHGEERLTALFVPLARAALERARGDDAAAEVTLRDGIALQEQHGAGGPQLRTATALAELLSDHSRPDEAREVLEPVLATFTEGQDTLDVVRAREVLGRADPAG